MNQLLTQSLIIRLTDDQRARLEQAVLFHSNKRGRVMTMSELIREWIDLGCTL